MHCDCSELEKLQTADNIKAPEAAQIREALQDILGGGDEVSQRSSPNHRNLLPHTPHPTPTATASTQPGRPGLTDRCPLCSSGPLR